MVDLNQKSVVVSPSKTAVKEAAERVVSGVVNERSEAEKAAPCALCGHYDDNPDGKGLHPVIILIQSLGGVFAGIALAFVNLYILPNGTWDTRETAAIGIFLISPSVVLLIVLFGLQLLGLHEAWMKMVVWIIGSCMIIVGLMFINDELLKL